MKPKLWLNTESSNLYVEDDKGIFDILSQKYVELSEKENERLQLLTLTIKQIRNLFDYKYILFYGVDVRKKDLYEGIIIDDFVEIENPDVNPKELIIYTFMPVNKDILSKQINKYHIKPID